VALAVAALFSPVARIAGGARLALELLRVLRALAASAVAACTATADAARCARSALTGTCRSIAGVTGSAPFNRSITSAATARCGPATRSGTVTA
jgi:hypothetical protein